MLLLPGALLVPGSEIHREITRYVLDNFSWRYVNELRDDILAYVDEPDKEGFKDSDTSSPFYNYP